MRNESLSVFIRCCKLLSLDKITIIKYVIILGLSTSFSIFLPIITMNLIDTIIEAESMRRLFILLALFLLFNILEIGIESILNIFCELNEFRLTQQLKEIMVDSLFKKNGQFYGEIKSGDLLLILENDTNSISAYTFRLFKMGTSLFMAVAIIIILFQIQMDLLLILLLNVPLIIVTQHFVNKKLKSKAEKKQK